MNRFLKIKRSKKILAKRARYGSGATHELLLYRSNKYIYAQVISLLDGMVVASSSSLSSSKALSAVEVSSSYSVGRIAESANVGIALAELCSSKNINPAINVAGYAFVGRVKALVEAFSAKINS